MHRLLFSSLALLASCAALEPCPGGTAPPWTSAATVVRVVDGDTVVVRLEDAEQSVRLKGIDCPEASNNAKCRREGDCADDIPRGRAATAAAELLLPPGSDIRLVSAGLEPERDRYDRLLAYVERSGEDVGYRLVEAGHCVDFSDKYPHPRSKKYIDAM